MTEHFCLVSLLKSRTEPNEEISPCDFSKVALGRGMSTEEKDNLKKELKSIKMEDISSFMESLPPDFLRILRME